ncbi:protein-arginine N-methyltransferase [Malassezia pachydermatis]
MPTDEADLDKLQEENLTTVEQCKLMTEAGNYDGIVVELANFRWLDRWEKMCLHTGVPQVEAKPGILPRSTSRSALATGGVSLDMQVQREAERWRKNPSFLRSELNLTKASEAKGVTVVISPWIELDAEDEGVRFDSELALRQEIAYAAYLGVEHIVLPPPGSEPSRTPYLADYARVINSCLVGIAGEMPLIPPTMRVSIRLPVSSPHLLNDMLARHSLRSPNGPFSVPATAYLRTNDNWAWETWDQIQTLCSYHPQLHVALDLSMPLPPTSSIERWLSEPVSLLWLPASSFLSNARGYPVLSKSAQSLVLQLLRQSVKMVLVNITSPPSNHTQGGPDAYLLYLQHLAKKQPSLTQMEVYAQGYGDHLQAPLQPMAHQLGASTYNVFESDPVKYDLYEEAMFQALSDIRTPGSPVQVWIVGAGHGALVTRCLTAAKRASRVVIITAVEKNPGACIGLQERQVHEWGTERIRILQGDMRTLPIPQSKSDLADIVVSELLGSFGDNELAPECLDGAMRFLKPNGISIPSSYTSYLAPITTPKLHGQLKAQPKLGSMPTGGGVGMGTTPSGAAVFDSPFVVFFQSMRILSSTDETFKCERVQPCWCFEHRPMVNSGLVVNEHGVPMTNSHNVRSAVHTFYIPHAGICHGLAGYFEAQLYKDVKLSIFPNKARASKDMVSWFPMFFPFREPLYVPARCEMDVHMWRLTDERRVWYEWSAEAYLRLEVSMPPSAPTSLMSPPLGAISSPVPASMTSADDSRQISASDIIPFRNAPDTPMAPSTATMGPPATDPDTSASSLGRGVAAIALPTITPTANRVKIGQTELMNAGARGSWLLIST